MILACGHRNLGAGEDTAVTKGLIVERREFFQSLIAGGATVKVRPERRNARAHHRDEIVYRGPFSVPAHVAAIVAEHPGLVQTTSGRHVAMRYSDHGTVYLFRCRVPEHRAMVGEIVRTPAGAIRVHAWSAADLGGYSEPLQIVERKNQSKGARL